MSYTGNVISYSIRTSNPHNVFSIPREDFCLFFVFKFFLYTAVTQSTHIFRVLKPTEVFDKPSLTLISSLKVHAIGRQGSTASVTFILKRNFSERFNSPHPLERTYGRFKVKVLQRNSSRVSTPLNPVSGS